MTKPKEATAGLPPAEETIMQPGAPQPRDMATPLPNQQRNLGYVVTRPVAGETGHQNVETQFLPPPMKPNGGPPMPPPMPAAKAGSNDATQFTPPPASSNATPAAAVARATAPQHGPAPTAKPATNPGETKEKSASGSGSGYTSPNLPNVVRDPEPGERLHHYEIIRLLGRGGMGSVYLARDTRLGRRVAIKFLRTQQPELTKRFILEARTTAACNHENIVVIFEVDAWQGSPFMVFEHLTGNTLKKIAPPGKKLPPQRVVELMVPVVRALAYAHNQGIVHRDLKPDNVMVTDAGITKVLDFGIAKVLQSDDAPPQVVAERPRAPKTSLDDTDDSELTQHGAMMGTLAYMAPEQWGIGIPIDHRSDIWAAGIMMFEMLAGQRPLDPLEGHQLFVTGVLTSPMPLLREKAPDVPEALAAVVDRCLLKPKDKRFPDAVSLLRALEPFLPGRYTREFKSDESPYAGLSSFQESDADRFFGRNAEIAATLNRVRERPLIGIVGSSGAGKSSFVRAGLIPTLKRSGEQWEAVVLRPGRDPVAALGAMVAPLVGTSANMADELEEQKKLTRRIAEEPGFLGSVLRSRARREKKNILLFIDQFEELYTLVPEEKQRKAFTAALAAAADDPTSPIRLVLSIRSDFLDRVPEDPRFMAELSQGLTFLNAPGNEGLREAIMQPAEMAGYRFENQSIVDDMLTHLASTQGALPLLQFAASKLWDNRDAARKLLTQKAYDAIGGISGALASHADAVIAKIPPAAQPLLRAIMLRLVTPDRTRAIVSLDELGELSKNPQEVQSLVNELVQARLIVVNTGGGAATAELVHESLISGWPALHRWLDESSEDSAFLDQLRTAAKQWVANKKDENLLWRGELAEEAVRFQRRFRGELGTTSSEFLDAVVRLGEREVKRKRAMTVGAVAFLSVLVAASLVALVVIARANAKAQEAASIAQIKEQEAVAALEEAKRSADIAKEQTARAEKTAKELLENEARLKKAKEDAEKAKTLAENAEKQAKEAARQALEARNMTLAQKQAADEARRRAEDLRKKADASAAEAKRLADEADARARRLETQMGGPTIETLK